MRVFLFVSTFLLVFSFGFSQSAKKAEKLLKQDNIPEATKAYQALVEKSPQKGEYHMNLGLCYLKTPQIVGLAIPELKKAIEIFEKKKKDELLINSLYLLAKAYHANKEFDDAIKTYEALKKKKDYKNYKYAYIIRNEIRAGEDAKEAMKKIQKVKLSSPGNAVNTEYMQHSPVYIEDKGIFIYTSKEKTEFNSEKREDGEYDENVFFINTNNENDREPDPYSAPLNSKEDDANCWVSKDGTFMLLYKKGNIYTSEFSGNNWTAPKKFHAVNSKYNEKHASMNQDRTICYFSSDRPGGKGGRDIYYVKKVGNKWSKAKNLGRKINTRFNEESPFIHEDGTLYFASEGHSSIGGYDIFKAKRSETGRFSDPENLGVPVNSVSNDLFYFLTSDKKLAYFMSDRAEGKGRGDIFKVDYADSSLYYLAVKGNLTNEQQTACNICVSDIDDKSSLYNQKTETSGDFSFNLKKTKKAKKYFVVMEADSCFFEALSFSSAGGDMASKDLGTFLLKKVNAGKVYKTYSVGLEDNEKKLNNENELFLNALVRFLNANPDLVIDLQAASDAGDKTAKKKIQTIVDFLKARGISEFRIFANLQNLPNQKDVLITVMDKESAESAFNNLVSSNNTDADDLDSGNMTGTYTIQLGAFKRKLNKSHRFFKDFRGKVKLRQGEDGLNRYTYGKYKYKVDAERYLITVHKIGFKDAFVREISWYK